MKLKKNQRGFTLIELMIAVAIIGILASLAMYTYMYETARAQASEALVLSGAVQDEVVAFYAQNGSFPANDSDIPINMPNGKYSKIHNQQNGVLVIQFTSNASSLLQKSIMALEAVPDEGGNIHWLCGNYSMFTASLAPSSCRNTINLNGYGN